MQKYFTIAFKFIKAFLSFVAFKIVFDWWRSGFDSLAGFIHSYSDILTEALCFALAWTAVTTKFWKPRSASEQ